MKDYKKLFVWQKSIELVKGIYLATKNFPNEEKFGLTSQIRRAVISVISKIAKGSCFELETQFIISKEHDFYSS